MSSTTHTITTRYKVEGIHESVMMTKSLLYSLNAVRLSIRDIQMVMSGPTIQNMMWTAIQLTRTYTHMRSLIKKIRAAMLTPTMKYFLATGGVGPLPPGILPTAFAFAMVNPAVTAAVAGTIIIGTVAVAARQQQDRAYRKWRERNREIAKSQGLEF